MQYCGASTSCTLFMVVNGIVGRSEFVCYTRLWWPTTWCALPQPPTQWSVPTHTKKTRREKNKMAKPIRWPNQFDWWNGTDSMAMSTKHCHCVSYTRLHDYTTRCKRRCLRTENDVHQLELNVWRRTWCVGVWLHLKCHHSFLCPALPFPSLCSSARRIWWHVVSIQCPCIQPNASNRMQFFSHFEFDAKQMSTRNSCPKRKRRRAPISMWQASRFHPKMRHFYYAEPSNMCAATAKHAKRFAAATMCDTSNIVCGQSTDWQRTNEHFAHDAMMHAKAAKHRDNDTHTVDGLDSGTSRQTDTDRRTDARTDRQTAITCAMPPSTTTACNFNRFVYCALSCTHFWSNCCPVVCYTLIEYKSTVPVPTVIACPIRPKNNAKTETAKKVKKNDDDERPSDGGWAEKWK